MTLRDLNVGKADAHARRGDVHARIGDACAHTYDVYFYIHHDDVRIRYGQIHHHDHGEGVEEARGLRGVCEYLEYLCP